MKCRKRWAVLSIFLSIFINVNVYVGNGIGLLFVCAKMYFIVPQLLAFQQSQASKNVGYMA